MQLLRLYYVVTRQLLWLVTRRCSAWVFLGGCSGIAIWLLGVLIGCLGVARWLLASFWGALSDNEGVSSGCSGITMWLLDSC